MAKNNMARNSQKPGAKSHVRFLEEHVQETLDQATAGPEPGKTWLGNAKVDYGKMGKWRGNKVGLLKYYGKMVNG